VTDIDISEFINQSGCPVARLSLSDEQRSKVDAALAMSNEVVSNSQVRRVLTTWGFRISRESIAAHRKKECSCD